MPYVYALARPHPSEYGGSPDGYFSDPLQYEAHRQAMARYWASGAMVADPQPTFNYNEGEREWLTIPGAPQAPTAPTAPIPVVAKSTPSGSGKLLSLLPAAGIVAEGFNLNTILGTAAQQSAGLSTIAKKLAMALAITTVTSSFQQQNRTSTRNIVEGDSMNVHPTIVAMRLMGRSFAYSGDSMDVSSFTLAGQSSGRRIIERLKSVLTLGQQVPEYLENLGLNDNSAELVEALLVDMDAMIADGTILVPEPRRGGETRSALFEQLNFLHFNLNNGNAWLTDNAYATGRGSSRRRYQ